MSDDVEIRKAEYLRGVWRGCDRCHREGARASHFVISDSSMVPAQAYITPERLANTCLCTDCWIGYLRAIRPTGLEKVGLR